MPDAKRAIGCTTQTTVVSCILTKNTSYSFLTAFFFFFFLAILCFQGWGSTLLTHTYMSILLGVAGTVASSLPPFPPSQEGSRKKGIVLLNCTSVPFPPGKSQLFLILLFYITEMWRESSKAGNQRKVRETSTCQSFARNCCLRTRSVRLLDMVETRML